MNKQEALEIIFKYIPKKENAIETYEIIKVIEGVLDELIQTERLIGLTENGGG